jgi:hypothetical protein
MYTSESDKIRQATVNLTNAVVELVGITRKNLIPAYKALATFDLFYNQIKTEGVQCKTEPAQALIKTIMEFLDKARLELVSMRMLKTQNWTELQITMYHLPEVKAPPRPEDNIPFNLITDHTLLEEVVIEEDIVVEEDDERVTLPWIELDNDRLKLVLSLRDTTK